MSIIPKTENNPVVYSRRDSRKSDFSSIDSFAITEWPGKIDDTSIFCEAIVQNTPLSQNSINRTLIPYVETDVEHVNYFDVYELRSEERTATGQTKEVDYADGLDKGIAAASGMLSGIIDILFVGEFSLDRAKKYGEKDVEDIVKKIARKFDYKGKDINDAIKYMEKKFPFAADGNTYEFGGPRQHHLFDFSHHFSIFGLLCSVMTQFTGKVIGTNKAGMLSIKDVADDMYIGKNFPEKVLFGTVYWFYHMVSDMAGSSGTIGRGTGIPGPVVSLIKTISAIPFFKNKQIGGTEFYNWVSRLFAGSVFAKKDSNGKILEAMPFDLRMEIGILHEGSKQLVPVLINEAIVRSFYFIRRTCREIKAKNIRSISELNKIDTHKILPFNNPAIKRMCTIASGVFCTVDMIDAVVRAVIDKNPVTFFLRINYVGIGRFIVAIGVEISSFLMETQIEREKTAYRKYRLEQEIAKLDWFTLNSEQTQVLISLERQTCLYDIEKTNDNKKKARKENCLDSWMTNTIQYLRMTAEDNQYFLDGGELIEKFKEVFLKYGREQGLLIVLEAVTFQPYFPTNEKEVEEFRNVHLDHHYMRTIFLQRQHLIQRNEFEDIRNGYHRYYDLLSGRIRNRWIIGAGTVVLTAITGGLAFHFAPAIAIALAGNAALHGAALASFSLAAIGGGSLAAGGLGVAGGTMIIAGGGGMIGLLGGATITSVTSKFLLESDGYVLNECSKLLDYCDKVLIYQEKAYIRTIELSRTMSTKIEYLKSLTEVIKDELPGIKEQKEKKTHEEKVKVAEKSIGYLTETSKRLKELANRIPEEKR